MFDYTTETVTIWNCSYKLASNGGGENTLCTCVSQVVQRKFRSDSIHVMPLETAGIITVEVIPYCRPMSHGNWGLLFLGAVWGRPCWLSVFHAGKYIALLTAGGSTEAGDLSHALPTYDPRDTLA